MHLDAALLSPAGAPVQLLGRWLAGEFELVVSRHLLAEHEHAIPSPATSTSSPSPASFRFRQTARFFLDQLAGE